MNTKWALCASKKTRAKTKVKLTSGGSYGYYTYHQAEPGDLAVIGYDYQMMDYAATSGKMGYIQECPDDLKIAAKNAVMVEHVFTQNVTPELIKSLAKIMEAPLNDGNLRVRTTGGCAPGCDYAETRYMITALTERLLAAASVLAHREAAPKGADKKAQEILCCLPLRSEEYEYFYKTEYGYELIGLLCRDELELTLMYSDLIKARTLYCYDSGYMEYLSGDDAFQEAQEHPLAKIRYEVGADEVELMIHFVNRCAVMNTVCVMIKCGLVNLMQEYLLAQPPVFMGLAALVKFAENKKAAWAVELLDAYRQGDWDKIRNYNAEHVMPIDEEIRLPEKPAGFDDTYMDKKAKASERSQAIFGIGMRWAQMEGWSSAELVNHCIKCCGCEKVREKLNDAEQMAERLKYLSGNMYDGDISEFSGKQFTLLNFDSASEKIFAKRIKEREGVKKGTVTKKTDYVVVCLSRWEQMSEEIDHAIRIHSEGNPVRLISEYTMWRAIEQTGIAEE